MTTKWLASQLGGEEEYDEGDRNYGRHGADAERLAAQRRAGGNGYGLRRLAVPCCADGRYFPRRAR